MSAFVRSGTAYVPRFSVVCGAGKLGISVEDYLAQVEAGNKWCSGCRAWMPRDLFHRRRSRPDGLDSYCVTCNRTRAREGMRRVYARRREAAS